MFHFFVLFMHEHTHTQTHALQHTHVSFKVYFYSRYGNDILYEDDEWRLKNKV